MDNLRRTTLHQAKGRSQDFMAVDQIAQTLLQDLNIERADDAITVHVRHSELGLPGAGNGSR